MKTYFKKSGNILLLALGIVILFSFTHCTRKITFTISPVVPAAEASIKLKKDKNKNYVIDLEVIHLADPSRLTPAKESYVVWIDTQNNGQKNIGQLKVSPGSLNGSLHALTSFKPTKVFITAENNTSIEYPGTVIVLTTNSF